MPQILPKTQSEKNNVARYDKKYAMWNVIGVKGVK